MDNCNLKFPLCLQTQRFAVVYLSSVYETKFFYFASVHITERTLVCFLFLHKRFSCFPVRSGNSLYALPIDTSLILNCKYLFVQACQICLLPLVKQSQSDGSQICCQEHNCIAQPTLIVIETVTESHTLSDLYRVWLLEEENLHCGNSISVIDRKPREIY